MDVEINKHISDAWVYLRKHNQTIPDEVLDDFKKILEQHYTQQQGSADQFDPLQLHQYYNNVKPIDGVYQASYAIFDHYGNQTGSIVYMGQYEWRYLFENFPAEKKFYSNNLPTKTKEQFEADVERTGLKLDHKAL
ncbi:MULTISPECIES: hypothetical protein [Acinetobacter]|uniref:Uncharacterized protein n=1 Tax=Acinetobacter indicus TaxID=756892 RepID=A0A6C0Y7E5_9GAMM|nr:MULTISPECIES: hypothetical protein [Acinetobacter]QIC72056.1 hypothetical protein FSC09_17005 [Acinetobacter indicus]QKQ71543.1 hypothetical protein E5Y90_15025 [Acinetobacter sp. 10FS3-1]